MTRPRARPRFSFEVPQAPDAVTARVRERLAQGGGAVTGSVFRRTLLLTVRPETTHFWSPHLDVQLDETAAGGTRVSAVFAPHPKIWTTFVGVQLIFALLSIAAGVWVTSALMLGNDLWLPLGALAAMLFGGGFTYGAAYVGQGVGSEQMYELRAFLEVAVRE